MGAWLVPLAPAHALECFTFPSDARMVASAVESLGEAAAALDGVVTAPTGSDGSPGVVAPLRVWFGPAQARYLVVDATGWRPLRAGERVRLALYPHRPEAGAARPRSGSAAREPLYETAPCSRFEEAMRYPAMRRAVAARSRQTTR